MQLTLNIEDKKQAEGIIIKPSQMQENTITQGEFQITYLDGSTQILSINGDEPHLLANVAAKNAATATKEQDGTIVIHLNGQVAVKQIVIKVTATSGNKLADIGQVEFLNDMESRIPAPTMNIPSNIVATPDDEKFTVKWDKQSNVSGYEVQITSNGKTEVRKTSVNTLEVSQFNNDKIKNYTTYQIKVQSINGEWKSGYNENTVTVIPMPSKVPDAPDNVSVKGGYRLLNVSWKNMKSTKTYTVYYKEEGQTTYQSISNIFGTSQVITGLKDKTAYKVYVTGTNEIGTSGPSLEQKATTTDVNPPITPNYKLINTPVEGKEITNHITKVTYQGGEKVENEFTVVDNNYTTSWKINSWDGGGFNQGKPSPIVEFDQAYKMDRLVVVPDEAQLEKFDYFYAKTKYWDEKGESHIIDRQYTKKTSSNGKLYYEFNYDEPIIAKKIQINFALYLAYGDGFITISEMKFYDYDSLEDDINNLYQDQLHVTLKEEVTNQTLDALQTRINTKDPASDEYHPRKELLQKELDTAREILNDHAIKKAIQVDTQVSKAYDAHITFRSGLNAMQPLGAVGYAGQTINVYVGNPNKKIGEDTNINLVATQYHAESSSWNKTVTKLKVGKNEVTIPKLQSIDVESGGSLYIEYTGNNKNEVYGVRTSGAMEIPILDITKASDEQGKKELVKQYVEQLEKIVPMLEQSHEQHKGKDKIGEYNYDDKNCIAGATDIVLKSMMYSVSSKQILAGLGNGTIEEKTEKLYQSVIAMEKMVDLFYQHKGLSKNPEAGTKNQLPSSRLNIRYQRMFAGAFMYAGGLHIGIEWGSVSGLTTSKPVQADEQGKYESGNYFGWGIAHEIGHIINEGSYAIAEITNNYYSVLAQAKDANDSVRFQYEDVYKKVTSNTTGRDKNVFTQLAMYWQLHLAYDKGGYNYKTYDNYQDQYDNLIFARMDTYARDINQAPSPNGIKLILNAGTDDNFMRLASAAAKKDLTTFFTKWGMTPNAETVKYISQFPKEEQAIFYINDEARAYQLAQKDKMEEGTKVVANLENDKNSNQVKLTFQNTAKDQDAMLGYEIIRTEYQKDKTIRKSVGFVMSDQTEFTDTIESVNNRTFTYEVIAYDKYLNQTEPIILNEIKIAHDGSLAKENWKVTTNMESSQDRVEDAEEQDPCAPEKIPAITQTIDNNVETTYQGIAKNQDPQIILELPEETPITALKYTTKGVTNQVKDFEIYISKDQKEWTKVKTGTFEMNQESQIAYFNKENDPQLYIYDAKYVKLIAKGQKNQTIEISELDLLGPTGDNIELLPVQGMEETSSIGILKEDYTGNQIYIPKGSLVFTGMYKGNPAYNAVLLYDEKNEIVGKVGEDGTLSSKQAFFAQVPEKGELGETSDGTWIYWIEPGEDGILKEIPKSVRAELYRVDNASTLEGERLVSNTLKIVLPKILPEIIIKD